MVLSDSFDCVTSDVFVRYTMGRNAGPCVSRVIVW